MCTCLAVAAAAGLMIGSAARAAVYTDATGENFDGNAHLDISSVEVTNDLTNITFKINISGNITSPDWGKYQIGIDTNAATGDTGSPVGNPWGRNIRMSNGMDAWVGSWADSGGGFQPWTFSGTSWTQNGQSSVTLGTSSTTITTSLASLGLTLGQTFKFDVYSSGGGGGDSANDALGKATQTINDWQVPYDSGANTVQYTVVAPEPAGVAGLALAGLVATRRRRLVK